MKNKHIHVYLKIDQNPDHAPIIYNMHLDKFAWKISFCNFKIHGPISYILSPQHYLRIMANLHIVVCISAIHKIFFLVVPQFDHGVPRHRTKMVVGEVLSQRESSLRMIGVLDIFPFLTL